MNLVFDISALPYNTGVSRYTANLAKALWQQAPNQINFFGSSFRQFHLLKSFCQSLAPIKKPYLFPLPPSALTSLFHQYHFPIDFFIQKAELFHSWDWYFPAHQRTRITMTIHDLALFKFPEISHPTIREHHQFVLNHLKQHQLPLIAVSQSTKNDLINLFDFNPQRIAVIYEALPEEAKLIPSSDQITLTINKYQLTRPFFLMVGTTEPRKNYLRQIQAWQKYRKDYDLVIVGKNGWETIPPQPGLIRLTKVSHLELACLYQKASLLLYCSLYEGFGLPILEGIFHSIPVVTSNTSSLIEIAPQYTYQADPLDVSAIITQINLALSHHRFQPKAAIKHIESSYSWTQTATQTLKFYQTLL